MKYPIIDNRPLTEYQKVLFSQYKGVITEQLIFDNHENKLGLSKRDIDLISWNLATRMPLEDPKLKEPWITILAITAVILAIIVTKLFLK